VGWVNYYARKQRKEKAKKLKRQNNQSPYYRESTKEMHVFVPKHPQTKRSRSARSAI
jgi:hypothetical protein